MQRDGDYNQLVKQFEKPGARHDQLKQQVAKEANTQNRMAAFKALQQELLGNPSTPGLMPLWDELFANAPDADKVTMLKTLASNMQGDREFLLQRATSKSRFGKSGSLFWQAQVYDNHFRYHQNDTRVHGADFISHLANLVKQQAQAGHLNETIFGLWLHSVDCKQPDVQELMKSLVTSPAYAKIGTAYQRTARDDKHFGRLAMTSAMAVTDPHHISRELLNLPEEATPAQVEAGHLMQPEFAMEWC